jgi:hypothetical protein
MSNFLQVFDLPKFDLYSEYIRLIHENKIFFSKSESNQICLNSLKSQPDDIHVGIGSLYYNWKEKQDCGMNGVKLMPVVRENPLNEEDFQILNSQFIGSLFEEAYLSLSKKYKLGRVRIIRSNPKTCMTWHVDPTPRLHYPIKTQDGCFMVIENEVKHLPQNTWWCTNTVKPHTAFNASKEDRIHLVAAILGKE